MPAPDILIDSYLALTQFAAERKRDAKPHDHLDKLATELGKYIDDWPPKRDAVDHATRGLISFTDRSR